MVVKIEKKRKIEFVLFSLFIIISCEFHFSPPSFSFICSFNCFEKD